MKKYLLLLLLTSSTILFSQNIDTLAFQNFEVTPASPVWTFTGPVIYNSGFSAASAAPANSPLGIGGSRAWETTTNSGGLILDFANTIIPSGYDSIRVRYNLAAMNLIGSSGGPDNLDYVLTAVSTDGGATYYNRLRIRGATTDNSFWAYSATAIGKVYYQPQTETMFQPTSTGLQTTFGYSTCEIVFPGTVTQISIRITARSSSSTDTWLIDNLVMTGENYCTNSTSSISPVSCGNYTSPAGNTYTSSGIYTDVIPNAAGCDSTITVNLTVNNPSTSTISPAVCSSYTSPAGNTYTSSGTYTDVIPNAIGCDSTITINLTLNNPSTSTISPAACVSYTSPAGNTYTSSGTYTEVIPNANGCDSTITINLTINNPGSSTISPAACDSYISPAGNTYTSSGTYTDVIPNANGCDSTITINLTINTVDTSTSLNGATITANASNAQYQWIDCNNGNAIIPGATSQAFTPSVNGSYAVVVSENNCTDTSSCVAVISLGISETNALTGFSVYPNPSSGIFTIRTANAEPTQIRISDMQGRIVLQKQMQGTNLLIDLSAQENGLYLVEVFSGEKSDHLKIIKQ